MITLELAAEGQQDEVLYNQPLPMPDLVVKTSALDMGVRPLQPTPGEFTAFLAHGIGVGSFGPFVARDVLVNVDNLGSSDASHVVVEVFMQRVLRPLSSTSDSEFVGAATVAVPAGGSTVATIPWSMPVLHLFDSPVGIAVRAIDTVSLLSSAPLDWDPRSGSQAAHHRYAGTAPPPNMLGATLRTFEIQNPSDVDLTVEVSGESYEVADADLLPVGGLVRPHALNRLDQRVRFVLGQAALVPMLNRLGTWRRAPLHLLPASQDNVSVEVGPDQSASFTVILQAAPVAMAHVIRCDFGGPGSVETVIGQSISSVHESFPF